MSKARLYVSISKHSDDECIFKYYSDELNEKTYKLISRTIISNNPTVVATVNSGSKSKILRDLNNSEYNKLESYITEKSKTDR